MKRYLRLYRRVFQLSLMRTMAYPNDFLTWFVVDIVWAIINIGFFRILLFSIPQLSGWTFETLSIPLGMLYLLNVIIWGMLWNNLNQVPKDIFRGNLDMYLAKPANTQFIVSTRYIGLNLIPSIVAGIFLLWYGFSANHISPLMMLLIPPAFVTGAIIVYSIWFISVTIAFWFNRLLNVAHVVPNAIDVARYPVTIFHPVIQFIFTYILPFAILGFLPAEIILGRKSPVMLLLPLLLAAVLLYLSHLFWNFSLRRYTSASS